MMPELRALFNEPRRLWAGVGSKIRGYADKKTVFGVRSNGAPAVFTLGRAESSAPVPDQGTGEEPVELRGGAGIRLHGYGGIHTLERVPMPLPMNDQPPKAWLEWEVEESWGKVLVCTLGESAQTPGNYVIVSTLTYEYTDGSYDDISAASGVTRAYGPDDALPAACDAIVYSTTYDPPQDGYGSFIGTTTTETLVSFETLRSSAVNALGVEQVSKQSQEFPKSTWQDVSTEVTPFIMSLGVGSGLGLIASIYSNFGDVSVYSLRFRLKNRGNVSLRVNCGFYGSGNTGGATDIESVINLSPGGTSVWQEVPSIDPDPAKFRTAEIRRVRIGSYRTVP